MAKTTLRCRIYTFYCLFFPLLIISVICIVGSIPVYLHQFRAALVCPTEDREQSYETEYSSPNELCKYFIFSGLLNAILTLLLIACCCLTCPFIWYLMNIVTKRQIGMHYSSNGYSAHERMGDSWQYAENFLPSYSTAARMGNEEGLLNSMVPHGRTYDNSMTADGYSVA